MRQRAILFTLAAVAVMVAASQTSTGHASTGRTSTVSFASFSMNRLTVSSLPAHLIEQPNVFV